MTRRAQSSHHLLACSSAWLTPKLTQTLLPLWQCCPLVYFCGENNSLRTEASLLREDIPRKKPLTFGHCPKGGRGVQPESKSFGVVFLGLLLDITEERGGRG